MSNPGQPVNPAPAADLPDDSVRPEFLQARSAAQRGSDSWIRALAQSGGQTAPTAPGTQPPSATTATPTNESSGPVQSAGKGSAPSAPAIGGTPGQLPNVGNWLDVQASVGSKILSGVNAVGSDLMRGAPQFPGQVLGGALDAFNNLSSFAGKAADQIGKAGIPNAVVQLFDDKGKWDPQVFSGDEWRKLEEEGKASYFHLPTTGPASAISSQIVRAGTTFLVGRGASGSQLAAAPEILRDFASGVGAMDPQQQRLSNVINSIAPNFITDWLKADPKDEGSLLGNLKSGLEYAGLGAMFATAKAGLNWLKGNEEGGVPPGGPPGPEAPPEGGAPVSRHPLPNGAPPPGGYPTDAQGLPLDEPEFAPGNLALARKHLSPADLLQRPTGMEAGMQKAFNLGDDTQDLVKLTPDIESKAQDYLANRTGDNPAWVNLARIKGPDDIKEALARIATQLPRQEVQSNESTQFLADSLGLRPQDFLAGYKGQNLNASETTAMRLMLDSSASQLVEYAARARGTDAGAEDMAAFLRAYSTHSAFQQYAMDARAEAGRTLQSWNIMATQGSQYTKAIQNIISNVGQQDVQKMASQISDLKDPLLVGKYVANTTRMTGRDAILHGFFNLLLSNPRTIIKKLSTDTASAFWNVATRYATVQSPIGMSGDIPPGEASQLAYGYVSAIKDGVRMAGRSLATGKRQFLPYGTVDIEDATKRLATLTDGAPEVLDEAEPTQNAANILRMFLPTRWIGATDDFAKYVNYRAELRALAFRSGIGKGYELGSPEMANHISDLMDNVPQDMHQQAVAAALRNTFQDPLIGTAKAFQNFADSLNLDVPHTGLKIPVGRILVPFVKVPFNLLKFAYRNSPLAAAIPSSALREELAAGGATRDLALAKMSLGTGVSLAMADLALSGTLVGRGPSNFDANQAWRRAHGPGFMPYSIHIGGYYYGYNSMEPFGMMMGAVADTFSIARMDPQNRSAEQAATSLAFGLGNSFLSKTYMSGLANFFDALENPDADAKSYSDKLINSMTIPQGVQGMAHAFDPWVRSHYDLLSTWESSVPYYSQNIPPAQNLWGEPIKASDGFLPPFTGTGLARMLSPIPVASDTGAEPIDKWVWDNKDFFPQSINGKIGLNAPGRNFSWSSPDGKLKATVPLTPQQYYHLRFLAGNGLKNTDTGLGAKDALNALVNGNYPDAGQQRMWNSSSPSVRAIVVLSMWNKYEVAAKKELMAEDHGLHDQIDQGLQQRAQILQGAQ